MQWSWGRWTGFAEQLLATSDSLYHVANLRLAQARKLEAADIGTLTGLATTTLPRVPHLDQSIFERLRDQAKLQVDSRAAPVPRWRLHAPDPGSLRTGLGLLPPPSPGDVFFDMEGFPYAPGGLEYLFGAVTCDEAPERFHDWWAHNESEERIALGQFLDWVMERWTRDPSLHIYHYAAYEVSALKRLVGKHGSHEAELDDLLRSNVFVDLYTVVRQALLIGTPGYSLKDVERLYRDPREGDVKTADGSVIAYQSWLDSGEPADPAKSKRLEQIRLYNNVDCSSTRQLRDWLLDRQREAGVAWVPPVTNTDAGKGRLDEDGGAGGASGTEEGKQKPGQLQEELRAQLLALAETQRAGGDARAPVTELIAGFVGFHRREEKPMWWRYFERQAMTHAELVEDPDCVGDLHATGDPPRVVARSLAWRYRFDVGQEQRVEIGGTYRIAGTNESYTLESVDSERGLAEIKRGKAHQPPDHLSLIPYSRIPSDKLENALHEVGIAWLETGRLDRATEDLLLRRAPRIDGHPPATPIAIRDDGQGLAAVVEHLQDSTLCIQGPPGTGKTRSAGEVIAHLLRVGKRIAITATSHKVIHNLLGAILDARSRQSAPGDIYKAQSSSSDACSSLLKDGQVTIVDPKNIHTVLHGGPVVVGGTAWAFTGDELVNGFDYLFVDEAGQFSLANAVAISRVARNVVLIGDQMQLSQPIQGTHPGQSGSSCLGYLLDGHLTVPPDRGVLLERTWRLSPPICRFISDTMYDGRLQPHDDTRHYRVIPPASSALVTRGQGIVWIPVPHEGCGQESEPEADVIEVLLGQLLQCGFEDGRNGRRALTQADILIVAPFNRQVRLLKQRLGDQARIGSVDLFQGQEAPVVLFSLCSSSLEETPRGAGFLLDQNRLNVAISRAQALAVVLGSPQLLSGRCKSIEEMRLVNRLCHVAHYSAELSALPG